MAPTLKKLLNVDCGLETKYIQDFAELAAIVKLAKESGFRVVLTQGVYDMFHSGHARYLADAKSRGDILIVGVDSDELTREMKGENRPFDSFEERIELLSHLASVNIITRRHTDQHKYDLMKLVHPDVLVISQTTATILEEDRQAFNEFSGELVNLERKSATTTTAKFRRLQIEGAQALASDLSKAINDVVDKHLKGE